MSVMSGLAGSQEESVLSTACIMMKSGKDVNERSIGTSCLIEIDARRRNKK
jgi:hypothetical protein